MRILLANCGAIVSGRLDAPLADGDSILIEDELVREVGFGISPDRADRVVDVRGATLVPGLVDTHSHPVIGDFTPRQNAVGWTARTLNGGVTSLVSAGETHWPGRQKDGAEAAAICAAAFLTSRARQPGCSRVFGGALLLDRGITEQDLDSLHALGVRRLGEIGLGSEKDVSRIAELVAHAKSLGWVAPLHFGGASVPGSSVVDAQMALRIRPTVISHANGGPTARPVEEAFALIEQTEAAIELVFAGNARVASQIVRRLGERGELHRLQFGTDTPSGTGVVPLALLRTITEAASLGGLDPAQALAIASGVAAARYGLRSPSGNPLGVIEEGAQADLVALANPLGSETDGMFEAMSSGNVPAVMLVLVDGEIAVTRSSVTPPPERTASLDGLE